MNKDKMTPEELNEKGIELYNEGNYEEAIKCFKMSANQGDALAQHNLGVCYEFGKGVAQSYEEAVKWYQLAAEQGNIGAQYNLGWCYEDGKGVKQSYEEAVRWYRLAAEQGDVSAQFYLAICYEKGQGVEQSNEEAVKWYRLAAEQGDVEAQYILGWCSCYGFGVQQSYEEAVKWYQLAADQGEKNAQIELGFLYYNGNGVQQSYEEAVKYFHLAADQGDADSQYLLGICCFYGNGINQNFNNAKEHFEKAIELGYDASYPIEICKRELGIEDENNYAREFIDNLDESNYLQFINDKLNQLFDQLPQTIESKTKTFIKSGLISYYMFYKIQKEDGEELDYTSCIIPMLKGLENEIKKYFIDKYIRYLETNVDVNECTNSYFINKKNNEYYDVEDRFNKFTLGDFKELIGLKENMSVITLSDNKIYDENKRTTRVTVIDFTILKFLKKEIFNKEKFTYNIDSEIIDYLVNLNDVITYCTKRLRNPAAHDLVMTREKAETTINYLLFTKQLLVKFYEKMK